MKRAAQLLFEPQSTPSQNILSVLSVPVVKLSRQPAGNVHGCGGIQRTGVRANY
jgi:hypothetical protein